jgi:nitrite reductase/ring-hydroxylating ferredoxin subunit
MQPEEAWIPLVLSVDLAPATALPVIVDNDEIVVWRSTAGTVQVWEDRCPHRGMRLSFGFVRGETLACLYHGWRYGTDAGCSYIPAHPDLTPPATICARAYPSAEADGVIWMRKSGTGGDPPRLPASVPVRSLTVDAPMDQVASTLAPKGERLAPGVFQYPVDAATRLVLALRPGEAGRTTMLVLTSGSAGLEVQLRAATWCTRFRHALETQSAAA